MPFRHLFTYAFAEHNTLWCNLALQMSDSGFGNISFVSNASNTPALAQVVIP